MICTACQHPALWHGYAGCHAHVYPNNTVKSSKYCLCHLTDAEIRLVHRRKLT